MAAALFAIDEATALGSAAFGSFAAIAGRPVKPWRRIATYTALALVATVVAGGGVWFATRPIPPRVPRFPLTTASADAVSINFFDRDLAITPDGSSVVYVGRDGAEILMRSLDRVEPTVLARGLLRGVFVAPDGQWVGFVGT